MKQKNIVGRGLSNKFTNNEGTKMSSKDTLCNFPVLLSPV